MIKAQDDRDVPSVGEVLACLGPVPPGWSVASVSCDKPFCSTRPEVYVQLRFREGLFSDRVDVRMVRNNFGAVAWQSLDGVTKSSTVWEAIERFYGDLLEQARKEQMRAERMIKAAAWGRPDETDG